MKSGPYRDTRVCLFLKHRFPYELEPMPLDSLVFSGYYIYDGYIRHRYKEMIMSEAKPDPEAFLPLTPAVFHILLALADNERHGYGIMQEVALRTDGKVRMGPGTLYGSIKRMMADGLLEESGVRPDPALDDERRRYYRLTNLGQRVAQAEARRLAALVHVAYFKHLLDGIEPLGGAS
jgi:DNA-binding PadR family transcriptional regulator